VIADLTTDDPVRRQRSLDTITRAYWKPVYTYLRLRWRASADQAEDLTQSFFEHAIARDALGDYDRDRARFRTFLRTCLDRHAIDQHRRATAARRGGGKLDVDFVGAEAEIVARGAVNDVEAVFDAEWLRNLVQLAIERFEVSMVNRGKATHAALFRDFHTSDAPPSYADAAARHGIAITDVTNWLHVAKREFRKVALELLAELTVDDDDFAAEARAVFGIDVRGRES
jgi:DNA-directed RNA polymerase specialized sigma24 family protein